MLKFLTALALTTCAAQAAPQVQIDDHTYFGNGRPDIVANIGWQAGQTHAEKMALSVLARLVRKYPQAVRYGVEWSEPGSVENSKKPWYGGVVFDSSPQFQTLRVDAPLIDWMQSYRGGHQISLVARGAQQEQWRHISRAGALLPVRSLRTRSR